MGAKSKEAAIGIFAVEANLCVLAHEGVSTRVQTAVPDFDRPVVVYLETVFGPAISHPGVLDLDASTLHGSVSKASLTTESVRDAWKDW